MRKAFLASLILVFALALTACGGSTPATNLDKANGDWTCDIKATMALHDEFKDQPDEAMAMVEAMFSSFNLNINAKDKKMTIAMGQMSEGGEFKVISDGDNKLVLEMDGDKATFEFTSDESITMYSEKDPNMKLVLKRKK